MRRLLLILFAFICLSVQSQVVTTAVYFAVRAPNLNVSNCVNLDYTTFANGTPTGFDATSNGGDTHIAGTADEISFISGQKYIVTFDLTLNSGTAPTYAPRLSLGGGEASVEGNQLSSAGSNLFEFTSNTTTTVVLQFWNSSTATNYGITNLSVKLN